MVEVEVIGVVGRPVCNPQVTVSHATVQLLLDAVLLPIRVKGYHLLCKADYSVQAVSNPSICDIKIGAYMYKFYTYLHIFKSLSLLTCQSSPPPPPPPPNPILPG